jgi:SAM-dependent methyltransferase
MTHRGRLKLHVGCGKRHIPGFVHIDQVAFPHVDHVRDIRDLSVVADGAADLLYACQVLEYFDREEVRTVLAEWRRVLAPGGFLRLSVPDFEVITRLYRAGLQLDWFLGTLYGRIADGRGGWIYHRTTYDEASLRRLLESSGFDTVERWDWRSTEHTAVDDYSQAYFPHMEKDRGIQWNLNMQARRATRDV